MATFGLFGAIGDIPEFDVEEYRMRYLPGGRRLLEIRNRSDDLISNLSSYMTVDTLDHDFYIDENVKRELHQYSEKTNELGELRYRSQHGPRGLCDRQIHELEEDIRHHFQTARSMVKIMDKKEFATSILKRISVLKSNLPSYSPVDKISVASYIKLLESLLDLPIKLSDSDFEKLVAYYYFEEWDNEDLKLIIIPLINDKLRDKGMKNPHDKLMVKKRFLADLEFYGRKLNTDNRNYINLIEETPPGVVYDYLLMKNRFMEKFYGDQSAFSDIDRVNYWVNEQRYPKEFVEMSEPISKYARFEYPEFRLPRH
jgi:hypothetical protein